MISGGIGGANTTTGQSFEQKEQLRNYFVKHNINIPNECFQEQHKFAKWVKQTTGKKLLDFWSREMRPDEALILENDIFIFEKKHQSCQGSADEKIQTCDFKKKRYEVIGTATNKAVHYAYLLNPIDTWQHKKYKDALDYIHQCGCDYFFETFDNVPLDYFGDSIIPYM